MHPYSQSYERITFDDCLLTTIQFRLCCLYVHELLKTQDWSAKTYILPVQINHQTDATIFYFIILTFIYSSTCFGRFPVHHQEVNDCSSNLWFYVRIVVINVLCSWSGRPARPRTQHDCHHDTNIKPEAATAVIELLIMGGKTPKTCWAVNKRQDNKLKNCCIILAIYLNCRMMHGLTNLKSMQVYVPQLMQIK